MSTPTDQPTVLWEPTDEQIERATITRFSRWVAETRGVDVADDYHALWRWSVEDVEGFWAAIWEFFDVQSETRLRAGAGLARDAGRGVVPGRDGELRAAHLPRPRRRRRGDPPRVASCASSASGRGATCARRPPRSRPACARWASSRATGSSRTSRTSPRRSPALPGVRVDRRDVVVVLAGLRRAQRGRPLRADRAEGAASRSTATATAARTSTASTPSRGLQGEMDSLEKTVVLPYLDSAPDSAGSTTP